MMRFIRNIVCGRLARETRGNATIEFVTSLPLVLVAFVFSFEFSNLFFAHHIATNNVRSATRYLARAPLAEPYLTEARNLARTGNPNSVTGAYDWMAAIQDSDITIEAAHETFTAADFRVAGQVLRIRMDVPYTFMTFNMLGTFAGSNNTPGNITLNIIEEARHIGE